MYRWVILCLGMDILSEGKISRKFDPYMMFLAGVIVLAALLDGVSAKTDRYPETFREFLTENLETIENRMKTASEKQFEKSLWDLEEKEQLKREEGGKVEIEVVITD